MTDTADTTVTDLTVHGMTCGHCVRAVTEELSAVDGVRAVHIELVAGGDSPVRVESDGPIARTDLEHAVDEAGYSLV